MLFLATIFQNIDLWLVIGLSLTNCHHSGEHDFLLGTWEGQWPNNYYQMRVTYHAELDRYQGHLTKQGHVSRDVGFSIGELVWEAWVDDHTGSFLMLQKWRWGVSGISIRYDWKEYYIHLEKGDENRLVTSLMEFHRIE